MSSREFSSELRPDLRLRACVLGCGFGCGVLGLIVIGTMPIAGNIRVLLAVLWSVASVRELYRLVAGYAQLCALRLDGNGSALVATREHDWQPATLVAGSIVLHRLAWLRIRAADGRLCAELFVGNCRDNKDWRRLQMIWRHLGAPP